MAEDKIKEYNHDYYLANKDKINQKRCAYYFANKEQCKANAKKYYQAKLNTLKVKDVKKRINRKKSKIKNKQAIIDANLANLLVKKELYKQKLLDEAIV